MSRAGFLGLGLAVLAGPVLADPLEGYRRDSICFNILGGLVQGYQDTGDMGHADHYGHARAFFAERGELERASGTISNDEALEIDQATHRLYGIARGAVQRLSDPGQAVAAQKMITEMVNGCLEEFVEAEGDPAS